MTHLSYMTRIGPVVLINDDKEDIEFIRSAIQTIRPDYQLEIFLTTDEAYNFLLETEVQPFIILCDVMLPAKSGIEFRDQIDANPFLKQKAIPFVFFTSVIGKDKIKKAYRSTIQGYVLKGHTFDQLLKVLDITFTYWENNVHPNNMEYSLWQLG